MNIAIVTPLTTYNLDNWATGRVGACRNEVSVLQAASVAAIKAVTDMVPSPVSGNHPWVSNSSLVDSTLELNYGDPSMDEALQVSQPSLDLIRNTPKILSCLHHQRQLLKISPCLICCKLECGMGMGGRSHRGTTYPQGPCSSQNNIGTFCNCILII